MNALKPYLLDNLPESFELCNENEVITDALVIVRIVDLGTDDHQTPERYEYTTSKGLPFAAARGMIECIRDELRAINTSFFEQGDDDGD